MTVFLSPLNFNTGIIKIEYSYPCMCCFPNTATTHNLNVRWEALTKVTLHGDIIQSWAECSWHKLFYPDSCAHKFFENHHGKYSLTRVLPLSLQTQVVPWLDLISHITVDLKWSNGFCNDLFGSNMWTSDTLLRLTRISHGLKLEALSLPNLMQSRINWF